MLTCNGAIADDVLRRIEGTYEMPSECTVINEKGLHERCGPGTRDRLSIRKLSEKTAQVALYSVQINGHQCEISAIAELVGDSLVYLEPRIQEEQPGQGLRIEITKTALVLGYLKPLTHGDPFCGTRAYVSRLKFAQSTKLK